MPIWACKNWVSWFLYPNELTDCMSSERKPDRDFLRLIRSQLHLDCVCLSIWHLKQVLGPSLFTCEVPYSFRITFVVSLCVDRATAWSHSISLLCSPWPELLNWVFESRFLWLIYLQAGSDQMSTSLYSPKEETGGLVNIQCSGDVIILVRMKFALYHHRVHNGPSGSNDVV